MFQTGRAGLEEEGRKEGIQKDPRRRKRKSKRFSRRPTREKRPLRGSVLATGIRNQLLKFLDIIPIYSVLTDISLLSLLYISKSNI